MEHSWPVQLLETTDPVRTLDDAKALIAQLANDELHSTRGCPPILLGVTLSGEIHYAPLDFQRAKLPFSPQAIMATAQALDQQHRMAIMGLFLPLAFVSGPASSQRVGAYLTMQNAFERQEALFLLEGKEFTERPSSHIQIDLPNPFTFLKRRMLA